MGRDSSLACSGQDGAAVQTTTRRRRINCKTWAEPAICRCRDAEGEGGWIVPAWNWCNPCCTYRTRSNQRGSCNIRCTHTLPPQDAGVARQWEGFFRMDAIHEGRARDWPGRNSTRGFLTGTQAIGTRGLPFSPIYALASRASSGHCFCWVNGIAMYSRRGAPVPGLQPRPVFPAINT
jgi:hypothetical protein